MVRVMKRIYAGLLMVAVTAGLSGCYYDPGYSYVRSSAYVGDAYYGGGTVVYDNGYYPSGYYGYYGCCYVPPVSIGISGAWFSGPRYYGHGYYHGGGRGYRGHWNGGYRAR